MWLVCFFERCGGGVELREEGEHVSLSSKENTLLLCQATKEKNIFLLSETKHRNKIITHTYTSLLCSLGQHGQAIFESPYTLF